MADPTNAYNKLRQFGESLKNPSSGKKPNGVIDDAIGSVIGKARGAEESNGASAIDAINDLRNAFNNIRAYYNAGDAFAQGPQQPAQSMAPGMEETPFGDVEESEESAYIKDRQDKRAKAKEDEFNIMDLLLPKAYADTGEAQITASGGGKAASKKDISDALQGVMGLNEYGIADPSKLGLQQEAKEVEPVGYNANALESYGFTMPKYDPQKPRAIGGDLGTPMSKDIENALGTINLALMMSNGNTEALPNVLTNTLNNYGEGDLMMKGNSAFKDVVGNLFKALDATKEADSSSSPDDLKRGIEDMMKPNADGSVKDPSEVIVRPYSQSDQYYDWLETDEGKAFLDRWSEGYGDTLTGDDGYVNVLKSEDRDMLFDLMNSNKSWGNRYTLAGVDISDPNSIYDYMYVTNPIIASELFSNDAYDFSRIGSGSDFDRVVDYLLRQNGVVRDGTGFTPEDFMELIYMQALTNGTLPFNVGDWNALSGAAGETQMIGEANDKSGFAAPKEGERSNPRAYKALFNYGPDELNEWVDDAGNPILMDWDMLDTALAVANEQGKGSGKTYGLKSRS